MSSLLSKAAKELPSIIFKNTTQRTRQSSSFQSVGIAGLGLMGHGICQVAASSNLHSSVIAFEAEQQFLDKGKERIESSVSKLVGRGKLEQDDADKILSSITYTTNPNDLADTDFIVEAVIENMDLKKDLYSSLGSVCKPETIFASNTVRICQAFFLIIRRSVKVHS